MALRDQPYLPLYVDDFMVDEKLRECSAESTGVYIRLICLMHKSEEYGAILLKQKDKQNKNICLNFASKLSLHLPYSVDVIERSLSDLVLNGVIQMDEDKIVQKRMVRDFEISRLRSVVGKKGGDKSKFARDFAQAKGQANTEYVYESLTKEKGTRGKRFIKPTFDEVASYCKERKNSVDPQRFLNYYDTRDWILTNHKKMADWKAAVRTWEGNDYSNTGWSQNDKQEVAIDRSKIKN